MITPIVAATVAPAPALADAVADKKAQAAALAQRINADARQVEVLAEQYNGAQYRLGAVQQEMATATQKLAAARATETQARATLANEAVQAYVHGGVTTSPTMRSFSGSVDFSVQQGYFQLATGNQAEALDHLRQSQLALRFQEQALQSAEADSKAALDSVTNRQQAVQSAQAASQATLSQVQGDLVTLVAQQQAQLAAQQQSQVKASLLAAQAKLGANANANASPAAPAARSAGTPSSPSSPSSNSPSGSSGGATTPTRAPTVGPSAPPTTAAPQAPPPQAPPPSAGAGAAIAYAKAQIGKPYQWGGAGPNGFDCSGLTMRSWGAAGVSLPHYARAQYANTAHVAIADLRPGDLVFFGSDLHHVGLYVGGGQMIDAPSTGEFVRYDSIFWPDLQPFGGRPG